MEVFCFTEIWGKLGATEKQKQGLETIFAPLKPEENQEKLRTDRGLLYWNLKKAGRDGLRTNKAWRPMKILHSIDALGKLG